MPAVSSDDIDPWWNSGWSYRKKITIDNTKVDADFTNFPVLISFSSDSDGKATVTFDIHTFGGYWIVDLYFGGQYFANDTIYYEPLQAHRNFFVSSVETPTPSPTTSPSPSPEPTFTPDPTSTITPT